MRNRLHAIMVFALIAAIACGCRRAENRSTLATNSPPPPSPPTTVSNSNEIPPLFEGNIDLRAAWKSFTANGRYRMAQPTDFKFSDLARSDMGEQRFREFTKWPAIPWWGGVGVIVVDTTRTDQNRFGLVVFLEPVDYYDSKRPKQCPYKPAWLYRNKDLSKTLLDQASGYWFVFQYDDSGKRVGRDERWFKSKHKNTCR